MTSLTSFMVSKQLLSSGDTAQNEPSDAFRKLESKRIKENKRIHLLESSDKHPRLSIEIKGIVRQIAEEPASTKNNRIMDQLIYGHYAKKTLPISALQFDLELAGLVELAREIGQRRFNDPALNPPRGIREWI